MKEHRKKSINRTESELIRKAIRRSMVEVPKVR